MPADTTMDRETRAKKVIEALNQARGMELYAITQYMHQHFILDDADYGELAANMKRIAIDEMAHAESFAERIKELDGEPVTDRRGKVTTGLDVKRIYPFDADVELDTIDTYNALYAVCRECGDSVSMKLFERIIAEEQEHQSYFDDVAEHIKNLGDTYLSKIAGTSASTGPNTKGFVAANGGSAG